MDVSRQPELAAHELLKSGYPFCPFAEYSLTDLPPDVLEWVGTRLDDGRPFVLRGFDKLDTWNHEVLNKNSLFQLLSLDCNVFIGSTVHASAANHTHSICREELPDRSRHPCVCARVHWPNEFAPQRERRKPRDVRAHHKPSISRNLFCTGSMLKVCNALDTGSKH